MKIITVSRQFGSGGRELGKRLSDLLNWDYYDREIIQALAEEQGMDPEAVHRMLSISSLPWVPLTIPLRRLSITCWLRERRSVLSKSVCTDRSVHRLW